MRKYKWSLLIVTTIILFISCKKNIGEEEPAVINPPISYDTKEIQINVPGNSSFKPAGSKVFSFGTEQTADASGKAKITFEKGSTTLAYVFNSDKKLVLAGFITDSTSVISPATTAKVLLYLGYNIPLQPDTLSVYFLNNINKLPGYQEWEKEFETLFLSDPMTLENKSFVAPLKARMAKMIDQTPVLDVQGKAAEIDVDANDVRSGIQIADDGLSNFKIINNYRRRAHAYLYKMSYKDMSGTSHTIKNNIDKVTKADKDMAVAPVAAVTGFLSEIGKNIEGKGLESFSVTTGPFPLELGDNESEALYKIRVVGPGGPTNTILTADEEKKEALLEMETFLLDFVIPAVSLASSFPKKDDFGGIEVGTDPYSGADGMMSFIKSMPEVYDEIKQGNYKMALEKLFLNVYSDVTGSALNRLYGYALGKRLTGDVKTFFTNNLKQLLTVLQMTDAALGASDLVRISLHLKSSYWIEEWQIKTKAGQVKLLPERSVVVPFQQQKLSAEIKNNTQTTYYEWSTTGKFGKLTDTKGHTDLASFNSPDKDVFYTSKVSNTTLSEGDNIDYIYVTAFAGGIKVGTDTAVINVKKEKYVINPTGVTLSGKDGSRNQVKLYLEKTNGTNEIALNNVKDYKVIWSTAGKYGKFSAPVYGVRTVTIYNDNSVNYECLDKDTKEATETITAHIYSKDKSAPESEFKLFNEVQGTIKINNDPKKIILHIPLTDIHGDTTEVFKKLDGTTFNNDVCHKYSVALVKEEKDAKSYSLRFYGQKRFVGYPTTYNWTPQNLSFQGPANWTRPKYANGIFTVVYTGVGRNSWTGPNHVDYAGSGGMAEVIITLK